MTDTPRMHTYNVLFLCNVFCAMPIERRSRLAIEYELACIAQKRSDPAA